MNRRSYAGKNNRGTFAFMNGVKPYILPGFEYKVKFPKNQTGCSHSSDKEGLT